MMRTVEELRRRLREGPPIVTDGGTGAELLRRTSSSDVSTARRRLDLHDVHRDFAVAGAEIVVANTFPVARDWARTFSKTEVAIQSLLVAAAQAAEAWIALSLGPGGTRSTYGDIANEAAASRELLGQSRVDAVFVETMTAIADADAAMRASARLSVPILVTFAVDADGVGYGGLSVKEIAAWARDAKPDAIGFNCGVGPAPVLEAGRRLREAYDLPLVLRPAASAPGHEAATPRMFGEFAREAVALGARVIGGCCGATPDHIRAVVSAIALG